MAVRSIAAPAIGAPPGPVRRPTIVLRWANGLSSRALLRPRQLALSEACAEAAAPAADPEPQAESGLAIVTWRSRTGAELPAASITLTVRWWAPFGSRVVSSPTAALNEGRQGCT